MKSRQLRRTTIFTAALAAFRMSLCACVRVPASTTRQRTTRTIYLLALVTEQTADQFSEILCSPQTLDYLHHDATLRPRRL